MLAAISAQLRQCRGLERINDDLLSEYGLAANIGVEIEFYLRGDYDLQALSKEINLEIKREKGNGQYEIELPPLTDHTLLLDKIQSTINILQKSTSGNVDFTAKPYPQDYGNSIHFHVNLLDTGTKANLFDNSIYLENAARALCQFMLPTFLVFAPVPQDYTRFTPGLMSPTHVCFGGNNRTVAIRIPDSLPKRLEHRLASPLVDTYLALFVLVKSLYIGLKTSCSSQAYTKIYGNAYDEQYQLPPLPRDIDSARAYFDPSFFYLAEYQSKDYDLS